MAVGKWYNSNYISSNLYCWQQPSCLYSALPTQKNDRLGTFFSCPRLQTRVSSEIISCIYEFDLFTTLPILCIGWNEALFLWMCIQCCLHQLLLYLHQTTRESLREKNLKIINSVFLPRSPFTLHKHLVMTLLIQSDQSIFSSVSSLSKCQQSEAQWCSSPQARWAPAIYPLLLE